MNFFEDFINKFRFKMKYLAAYCLAALSGNASPSADDLKKILTSVGVEVDAEKVSTVVNSLKGKEIHEVKK
jgi:large subunit ribosomal protein LP2